MDLAYILRELWRLRTWVAVGMLVAAIAALAVAYRLDFFPPSLKEKSLQVGAASTELLVDSQRSPLADLRRDVRPLTIRAEVYARFMTSEPVKAAIGREVGVPATEIVAQTQSVADQPRAAQEPFSEQRANDLISESKQHRLMVKAEPGLPIISIFAQAATSREAIQLANGAASGVRKYLAAVEGRQSVRKSRRVKVRQLGRAQGGVVNKNANTVLAVLTFLAVLVGTCVLTLVGSNVAKGWRRAEAVEPTPTTRPELAPVPDHEWSRDLHHLRRRRVASR